jgi:hypothetical protein
MKTFLALPLFLLALLISLLSEGRAAVDRATIAADARWVAYLDLDTLRTTTLGKELVETFETQAFRGPNGTVQLDPRKVFETIGSITAYGSNLSTDPAAIDGTLIARGTPELRKIAEALLLQATLTTPQNCVEVKDLPFPAYAVIDIRVNGTKQELFFAFPPQPVVIASKSKAQILKAVDVLRGAAPSLANTATSPIAGQFGQAGNAYLFAASIIPPGNVVSGNGPEARILQLTSAVSLAVGETAADLFAHVELKASSTDAADKLEKILQGLVAMVGLTETNDRQLADFINAATLARNNDAVSMHLVYPSARLVQMIQNAQRPAGNSRPVQNFQPPLTVGTALAQWASENNPNSPIPVLMTRTIDNVTLTNGMVITLGSFANGRPNTGFVRLEISQGGAAPLVFRREFMKNSTVRGATLQQVQFPGADGVYTLSVAYMDDQSGKAKYAASVKDPGQPQTAPMAR